MWRLLNKGIQDKFLSMIPSNDSTYYCPTGGGTTGSSDIGRLMMYSSNTGACLGSSDFKITGNKIAGILVDVECELDYSSCATNGSTACRYKVQPIYPGDMLEVDYSTLSSAGDTNLGSTWAPTTNCTGDLHTTNIGMYYNPGNSSASTNPAKFALMASVLNVTTGLNAPSTYGYNFMLVDYSTVTKRATVMYGNDIRICS
jgi:hypothetical protein